MEEPDPRQTVIEGAVGAEKQPSPEPEPVKRARPPRKVAKRKPIWLAVPTSYVDVVQEDGEIAREPASYDLKRCVTRAEVIATLKFLQEGGKIDGLNAHFIKVFRGDPIDMKISTQVAIKF